MEISPDDFFAKIPELQRSGFLFLRQFFTGEQGLKKAWKFHPPFYYFKGKWFAFISYHTQKDHELYIAFVRGSEVSHPAVLAEGRNVQRIFRILPEQDINLEAMRAICGLLKDAY